MDTSKTIILSTTTLIALAFIVMLSLLLTRKVKTKNQENGKLKLSFGIWFGTFFLSGSLIITRVIAILSEAIDNLYKINPVMGLIEIFKTSSLFLGLSLMWLFLWYFIVNQLSIVITGKRNFTNEIEVDNYIYFFVRGILLVGFIICLSPVFEIILRTFIPSIQIPFYH